jgi:hypothetical protein
MSADQQFWHYTKEECIEEVPHARGVYLSIWKYENLVLPDVDGVRDVYAVFENGIKGLQNVQWFPITDLNKAAEEFRRRESAPEGAKVAAFPLTDIEEKWGESEEVANCRRKGKDLTVTRAAGLFYVDFDGRRTQVRLDDRAVVRYLVHALEDAS